MTLKRACDFAVYILIGITVSLGIVWYAWSNDGGGTEPIGKWIGLGGATAIVFGYAIRTHRLLVQRLSFWLVILVLLVIHLSIFIVILKRVEHWKILWFVLAYPVEDIAIDGALSLTGHSVPGRDRHHPLF